MRAYLCWNCGKLCTCTKIFPSGRPKRRSECADYTEAPPEAPRITHREMAEVLDCSVDKIGQLVTTKRGMQYLIKALARKGIIVTYERIKNRIYFYREEEKQNER